MTPATCNFVCGDVVPMPTLPIELIRTLSVPSVEAASVLAAGRNHPIPTSPAKLYVGAAAVPVLVATDAPPVTGEVSPVDVMLKIVDPPTVIPIAFADGLKNPVSESALNEILGAPPVPAAAVTLVAAPPALTKSV